MDTLMTPTQVVVLVETVAVLLVEMFNRMEAVVLQTLVVAVVVLVVDRTTMMMVATVETEVVAAGTSRSSMRCNTMCSWSNRERCDIVPWERR